MSSPPRAFSLSGLVLLALYGVILLGSLWPIQLLAPVWQLRMGATLINSSPFALIGLVLLHLAVFLDPEDQLLRLRRRRAESLAVAAALGFLLLIPLLSLASLRQQQSQVRQQSALVRKVDSHLQTLRQAVTASGSSDDLEQRLKALDGPRLDAADRTLPLPLLRSRVNALIDQAADQVARQSAQVSPIEPLKLLPEILRTGLSSLILAIGFAGLARRPGLNVSLLEELLLTVEGMGDQQQQPPNGISGGSRGSRPIEEEYFNEISRPDD